LSVAQGILARQTITWLLGIREADDARISYRS
jgi:hypothetical protein